MDRRKSLKIIGGSVAGIAGLVFADWKWQIVDRVTHSGFFTFEEEKLISSIAEIFIPEGLPPILPSADAKPIGALSTGTDQFLIKLFEKCYEKEDQDLIKAQLKSLGKAGFLELSQEEKEKRLLALKDSDAEEEKKFYNLMRSNTVLGFTTVKEVMVEYRGYQVAPGYYKGCVDVPAEKA
ncbi:gluconate 2-dehydrogenase subunit 3 family protein [Algoriphagus sp. AK58]|uniref:gluconate 2-dehydrogenase subunit 3 family protein n=1 Tax=Algoriphagus sp. AK58 TaxID=1406877 RepID=UPI00164F141A|nr:gluconate 2-dehydrogenase subunit 3 family protein [Algoriphagus sp. AK58]MBC6367031.1 Tat (twin-arginine translocation) pathway signal sequence containing protein [Algoriphagus sp. AK58]